MINFKGNILVNINYNEVSIDNYFSDEDNYKYAGYIVSKTTEEGYRYGYIDVNGKEILKNEFNEVSRITDMKSDDIYLLAAKDGRYGIYKNSDIIVDNEYQSIRYEKNTNVLVVEKSKKFGVLSLDGQVLIPIQYSQIDITGKYIYAKNNEEVEVFDNKGNKKDINENIFILPTENENYQIKIDSSNENKYSIVDKNEQPISSGEYSYLEYLYDDYFIASSFTGKLGVIDANDVQKIDIKYSSIEEIQGSKMLKTTLAENNSIQIFSSNFEEIANMENANIYDKKEYIKLYNENTTINIDKNEEKQVQNIDIFTGNTLFAKSKDGKWGFVDKESKIVVDFIYDKVTDFNIYGFAGIKKDGMWGVIDKNGTIVLEPTYTFDNKLEPDFISRFYRVEYGYGESYYSDAK